MKEIKTRQGWRVVPVTLSQITKLGGLGICDSCNSATGNFMYIGVLNSAYCQQCYEEWEAEAKYYPVDVFFETNNLDYVKGRLE